LNTVIDDVTNYSIVTDNILVLLLYSDLILKSSLLTGFQNDLTEIQK